MCFFVSIRSHVLEDKVLPLEVKQCNSRFNSNMSFNLSTYCSGKLKKYNKRLTQNELQLRHQEANLTREMFNVQARISSVHLFRFIPIIQHNGLPCGLSYVFPGKKHMLVRPSHLHLCLIHNQVPNTAFKIKA